MNVTDVRCFPVSLPFCEPFVIANLRMEAAYYVVVRVQTDEGVTGWGEGIPAWEVTGETQLGVIDAVHLLCAEGSETTPIGSSIASFEDVSRTIQNFHPTHRPQIVAAASSAKAVLEQALLDACAKGLGRPVCELFGGSLGEVPVSAVIGINPVDETLRRVQSAIESDAPVIKLKVGIADVDGRPGFQRDVDVILESRSLVDASGKPVLLVADANQGYVTADIASVVARQIEGCLNWLEQPVLAGDLKGFQELKQATGITLMADESVHGYEDAQVLLHLGGVDLLNLKLVKTGGLFEALRIAGLAAEHGVLCQMGSMLENVIGLAAGAHAFLSHPNIHTTELCTLGMLSETIGDGVQQVGHQLELTRGPGYGVTVLEDDVQAHLIDSTSSRLLRDAQSGFRI